MDGRAGLGRWRSVNAHKWQRVAMSGPGLAWLFVGRDGRQQWGVQAWGDHTVEGEWDDVRVVLTAYVDDVTCVESTWADLHARALAAVEWITLAAVEMTPLEQGQEALDRR